MEKIVSKIIRKITTYDENGKVLAITEEEEERTVEEENKEKKVYG